MNNQDISTLHTPVMLERITELLEPVLKKTGAVYVDCTLGLGGHTEAILRSFPNVIAIGIDRDQQALQLAEKRLSQFGDRVSFYHGAYNEIDLAIAEARVPGADGILFDLGVSSMQLDEADRGFSYSQDAPLDMRMNEQDGIDAEELLNSLTEGELARIFSSYGEEPLARRYAKAIAAARKNSRITTSAELVEILQEATPYSKKNKGHPAKRVFQALRIAVNDEIRILEEALPKALEATNPGGRVVAMSYHSLEDRIVKNVFRDHSTSKTPQGVPVELEEFAAKFRQLTRKPEIASADEQALNPRSKPVKVRAVEKVGGANGE